MAKKSDNRFPLDAAALRDETGLKVKGCRINFQRFIELGLIELIDTLPEASEPEAEEPKPEPAAKGQPEAPRKPRKAPDTYVTKAAQVWSERFAGGAAPFGRIGKALKPLVAQHGEEKVLAAWSRYLVQDEGRFLSAENFASRYGEWAGVAGRVHAENPGLKESEDLLERMKKGDIL